MHSFHFLRTICHTSYMFDFIMWTDFKCNDTNNIKIVFTVFHSKYGKKQ